MSAAASLKNVSAICVPVMAINANSAKLTFTHRVQAADTRATRQSLSLKTAHARGLFQFCHASPTPPARRLTQSCRAAAATPPVSEEEEVVFYEGSGSNAELAVSLLLGATLIYLPLSLASLGRRLWVTTKFTNKRLIIVTSSPVFKREVQVEYKKIKEVRSVNRAAGLWGDMVVFLKDGATLEIIGLEKVKEIQEHIEKYLTTETIYDM